MERIDPEWERKNRLDLIREIRKFTRLFAESRGLVEPKPKPVIEITPPYIAPYQGTIRGKTPPRPSRF